MRRRGGLVLAATLALGTLSVSGCGNPFRNDAPSDRLATPRLGSCRDLRPADVDRRSNDTAAVACSKRHTAQTFAIGTLPASTGTTYDDRRHGTFVYQTCQKAFGEFLGIDESLAMRVQLSWAWFRPSERGWRNGARWYRCDLLGGPDGARTYRPLPGNARGLFSTDLPAAWLTCARGATVARSTKVPCSEAHDWRAVTTVKIGQPGDAYPGDRVVQVRTRDYCQESVGGWMHYPPDYDYGYSWFREAQWKAGNRRSVCWARTNR